MLAGQIGAGLAVGGVYALMAVAIVLSHRTTGIINFAQGEMAMFSAFLGWQGIAWGFPWPLAFALAVLASVAFGLLIGAGFHRTLGGAPPLARIAATIALFPMVNSAAGLIWGHTTRAVPSPFGGGAVAGLPAHTAGTIVATLAIVAALGWFLRFTTTGLSLRAAADDPVAARLLGVAPGWSTAVAWGLSSGLGAAAGILVAPTLFLDPGMMSVVIVFGMAAAVVGGLASPAGAVIAGYALGIGEALMTSAMPTTGTELKLTLLVLLIVGVLLLRPSGLLATSATARD